MYLTNLPISVAFYNKVDAIWWLKTFKIRTVAAWQGTGCTSKSAGTCPWEEVPLMSNRYSLNQPIQVLWLLNQKADVNPNPFIDLLGQDACFEIDDCVVFASTHNAVSFWAIIFTHFGFCRRFLFLTVSFFLKCIKKWHAISEDLNFFDGFRWNFKAVDNKFNVMLLLTNVII